MVCAAVVISEDRAWAKHLTLVAEQAGLLPLPADCLSPAQPFVALAAGASLRRLGRLFSSTAPGGFDGSARGIVLVAPVPMAGDQPPWPVPVHALVPWHDLSWWQARLGVTAVSLAPAGLLPATAEAGLWARGLIALRLAEWLGQGTWLTRVVNDADFGQAFALRQRVFVDEQAVPINEELDATDTTCQHLLLRVDGNVVGTGRLIQPEQTAGSWHLGRIAVDATWRGQGHGQRLVLGLEQLALALAPTDTPLVVELSAQLQAAGFYQNLGYELFGSSYLDAGILHCDARKVLRA